MNLQVKKARDQALILTSTIQEFPGLFIDLLHRYKPSNININVAQ